MARLSCVVVGGGVTGLAVAHRLLVLGRGKIGVTVLEAQSRTGGMITVVITIQCDNSAIVHLPTYEVCILGA